MRTRDDIEAYLDRSGHPYTEIDENTWVVGEIGGGPSERVVVRLIDQLCIFRMKVVELANVVEGREREFYRLLLELNGSGMVYASYGISEGMVLLLATLPLENLDYNEFSFAVEDFMVSMAKNYARLAEHIRPAAKAKG